MPRRSAAQVFALVIGVTLVGAGIVGFFYDSSFASGSDISRDAVLGILDVNGWHNLVHIASGAIGLAVVGSWSGSRTYAIGLGLVYTVVAIAGFIAGNGSDLLNLVPVNTEDNVLHALIAFAGLAAGQATPVDPPPTTIAPA